MAQRYAVLLVLASVVVLALADMPAAEVAKYKENKEYDHKHEDKHYKNKEYKPDYKPDYHDKPGYQPEYSHDHKPSYKPDYHDKHYDASPPYGSYGHYEHDYQPYPYGHDGPYAHPPYGYQPSHEYDTYGAPPSPYDGGYWGGPTGRQIIKIRGLFTEELMNQTLYTDGTGIPKSSAPNCDWTLNQNGRREASTSCLYDFGILCGLRKSKDYGYDSYESSYASESHPPLLPATPTHPVSLGYGALTGNFDLFGTPEDVQKLVDLGNHRYAYQVGQIAGGINFVSQATACHPLLGAGTFVDFTTPIPVYAMWTKTKIPADPAWAWRIWMGLKYAGNAMTDPDLTFPVPPVGPPTAKIQGVDKSEYKTAPDGSKYVSGSNYIYRVDEKDGSLCGLTLVAKGPVTVTVDPPADTVQVVAPSVYTGTIESPLVWFNGIVLLPGPQDVAEEVMTCRRTGRCNQRDLIVNGDSGPIQAVVLEKTLERIDAMCKQNDIPFADIGSITLDVSLRTPPPEMPM